MREEEAIVGDEEGRTSTVPPDHLRCNRYKGRVCRCKRWRFHRSVYCEYHYNQRLKYREKEREKKNQVIENKLVINQTLGKRRRSTDFIVFTSTHHDDEQGHNFILSKKTKISTKASERKEMEKYNISELILSLKSSFLKQEFENVDKILQMREDKMKMEKQEAQKQAAQFKQELGIFKTMCGQLKSEVEKKKKDIFEVKDNLLEMEIKNLDIQHELERCNRKKDELKEKVGCLEKEVEIVRERERRSEERFTKMSCDLRKKLMELERKNRDLHQSETQVLLEPQGPRKEYGEPRGSQSNVSCSKQGKNNQNGKWRIEGVIEMEATEHDRGFYASANLDSISQSLTRARVPEEAEKCVNKQTKTQSEARCALTGACSPNLNEALNCGGRSYVSAKVDLDCCSPSGETRVAQLAGAPKESESKQIKFPDEATHMLKGATVSQTKIKEEALNCDERLCTSPILDSIYHSAREEAEKCENKQTKTQSEARSAWTGACSLNLKEALNCGGRIYASAKVDLDCCSPSGQNRAAQPAGVTKKSESKQIIFQNEATHALEGATLSQIKIKEEVLNWDEKLCTSPTLDSICHSARGKNSQESPLSRQKSISPLVSEERKGSEVRHTRFQNEASCALTGAKFSEVKIREEALNCGEKLYTSATGDSIHHSIRGENSKESTPSRHGLTSLQQSNEGRSTQTKFQREASCALNGVKLSQVKVKEEPLSCNERFSASASVDSAGHCIGGDNVKDASISRSRSMLLDQIEQKRSAAEQILSNQFQIIESSCKQSRNTIAENDSEKEAKELGADCDCISAFLCELRRLKANKPNLTLKHT